MFPEKNIKAFRKANFKDDFFGYNPYNLNEIYACFIQGKINTNLMLLSNPDLIRQFDLDYDDIVAETKKLIKISKYIEIPDFVEEKRRR